MASLCYCSQKLGVDPIFGGHSLIKNDATCQIPVNNTEKEISRANEALCYLSTVQKMYPTPLCPLKSQVHKEVYQVSTINLGVPLTC